MQIYLTPQPHAPTLLRKKKPDSSKGLSWKTSSQMVAMEI